MFPPLRYGERARRRSEHTEEAENKAVVGVLSKKIRRRWHRHGGVVDGSGRDRFRKKAI